MSVANEFERMQADRANADPKRRIARPRGSIVGDSFDQVQSCQGRKFWMVVNGGDQGNEIAADRGGRHTKREMAFVAEQPADLPHERDRIEGRIGSAIGEERGCVQHFQAAADDGRFDEVEVGEEPVVKGNIQPFEAGVFFREAAAFLFQSQQDFAGLDQLGRPELHVVAGKDVVELFDEQLAAEVRIDCGERFQIGGLRRSRLRCGSWLHDGRIEFIELQWQRSFGSQSRKFFQQARLGGSLQAEEFGVLGALLRIGRRFHRRLLIAADRDEDQENECPRDSHGRSLVRAGFSPQSKLASKLTIQPEAPERQRGEAEFAIY